MKKTSAGERGANGEEASILASEAALRVTVQEIHQYRELFAAQVRQLSDTRKALDRSREQSLAILDSAPLTQVVVDGDDVIQHINAIGLKLLEAPVAATTGQALVAFVQPESQALATEHLAQCRRTSCAQVCELELRTRSGRSVPVLLTSHPSRMGTDRSRFVRIGITDISERKARETALRDYALQLEEAKAALEMRTQQLQRLSVQLCKAEQRERHRIADLLHDHVQQILVACRMNVDVMVASAPSLAPKGAELVSMLQDAITELRTLSAHLRPPALREQGLTASLRWLAGEMEAKHGLKVHLHADFGIERLAHQMHDQLFQIIRELLFNVVKHARTSDADILFTLNEAWQTIDTVVRDGGRGMDFSGESAAKEHFGLTMIRERVAAFGGDLSIESGAGHGTAVTVRLPLHIAGNVQEEEPGPAAEGAPSAEVADSAQTVRVLIADDHAIVRQGLVMLLQREPSIEVIGEANNGEEALELARRHLPDVVLMDLNMPRMDGVEATRLLKAEFPHIGVVGLSMHGEDEMAQAIRAAGADDYVSKVAPSDKLVGAIRRSLHRVA